MIANLQEQEVSTLRSEILESEKARIDLLKYKLLAVAALGAVGISVNKEAVLDPQLVLLIMPIVCLYIDSLCWHNSLRILIIGHFLKRHDNHYEKYLDMIGKEIKKSGKANDHDNKSETHAKGGSDGRSGWKKFTVHNLNSYDKGAGYLFQLEDWALYLSTISFSIIVLLWGLVSLACGRLLPYQASLFFLIGMFGVILSYILRHQYNNRVTKLDDVSMKYNPTDDPTDSLSAR